MAMTGKWEMPNCRVRATEGRTAFQKWRGQGQAWRLDRTRPSHSVESNLPLLGGAGAGRRRGTQQWPEQRWAKDKDNVPRSQEEMDLTHVRPGNRPGKAPNWGGGERTCVCVCVYVFENPNRMGGDLGL